MSKTKNKKTGCGGCLWLFTTIGFIIIGIPVVSALLLRTLIAEVRWHPSGSMEPTLHGSVRQEEADKMVIDKITYRFQQPKRGDIIVFYPTETLKQEQYQDAFLKRIVALPGEHVYLKGGDVYVNNQPLQENYIAEQHSMVVDVCTSGSQPPYLSQPVTIPPDSYLVLGDNRKSSYDSRCWGIVPKNHIIGKVATILKN